MTNQLDFLHLDGAKISNSVWREFKEQRPYTECRANNKALDVPDLPGIDDQDILIISRNTQDYQEFVNLLAGHDDWKAIWWSAQITDEWLEQTAKLPDLRYFYNARTNPPRLTRKGIMQLTVCNRLQTLAI